MRPIYDLSEGRRMTVYTVISPRAAAWLFQRDDSVLRKLALAGEVPTATVSGWGGKASRFYSFDALCDRYGEPAPDHLSFLRYFGCVHVGGAMNGAATIILVLPPGVEQINDMSEARRVLAVDELGGLAIKGDDDK